MQASRIPLPATDEMWQECWTPRYKSAMTRPTGSPISTPVRISRTLGIYLGGHFTVLWDSKDNVTHIYAVLPWYSKILPGSTAAKHV